MAALIAGNYEGRERKIAYAVIGGVAGAGIAIGPILGGWATTELSWRVVFAGEVVLVAFILIMTKWLTDALRTGPAVRLDGVGSVLVGDWSRVDRAWSAAVEYLGLGEAERTHPGALRVLADALRDCVGRGSALGLCHLAAPPRRHWDAIHWFTFRCSRFRRCAQDSSALFTQNLTLMGVFFVIPLFLQLVLGLDALDTGIKMLPVSITMFAHVGDRFSTFHSVPGAVDRSIRSDRYRRCRSGIARHHRPDLAGVGVWLGDGAAWCRDGTYRVAVGERRSVVG